jgi:hypothetical protein
VADAGETIASGAPTATRTTSLTKQDRSDAHATSSL